MFLASSCSCLCSIHWSQVENKDVVGQALFDPTTSEWQKNLMSKMRVILEVWWYFMCCSSVCLPFILHYNILFNLIRDPSGQKNGHSKPNQWSDYDFIKWKHFPCWLALCEGNPPADSPHKSRWHGALTFSLICTITNGAANNRDAVDLRRHHVHYDVTVMGLLPRPPTTKVSPSRILRTSKNSKIRFNTMLMLHQWHVYNSILFASIWMITIFQ